MLLSQCLPWLLRIWRPLPGSTVRPSCTCGGDTARFAIGVAALIRDEQGRILLVHRDLQPRGAGWAMPGAAGSKVTTKRSSAGLERPSYTKRQGCACGSATYWRSSAPASRSYCCSRRNCSTRKWRFGPAPKYPRRPGPAPQRGRPALAHERPPPAAGARQASRGARAGRPRCRGRRVTRARPAYRALVEGVGHGSQRRRRRFRPRPPRAERSTRRSRRGSSFPAPTMAPR